MMWVHKKEAKTTFHVFFETLCAFGEQFFPFLFSLFPLFFCSVNATHVLRQHESVGHPGHVRLARHQLSRVLEVLEVHKAVPELGLDVPHLAGVRRVLHRVRVGRRRRVVRVSLPPRTHDAQPALPRDVELLNGAQLLVAGCEVRGGWRRRGEVGPDVAHGGRRGRTLWTCLRGTVEGRAVELLLLLWLGGCGRYGETDLGVLARVEEVASGRVHVSRGPRPRRRVEGGGAECVHDGGVCVLHPEVGRLPPEVLRGLAEVEEVAWLRQRARPRVPLVVRCLPCHSGVGCAVGRRGRRHICLRGDVCLLKSVE
eukprot:PhM_4_TR5956/c0_g11_i2/m.55144